MGPETIGLHFGFFFNLLKVRFILEATVGYESMNEGFADPCTAKKEPYSPIGHFRLRVLYAQHRFLGRTLIRLPN